MAFPKKPAPFETGVDRSAKELVRAMGKLKTPWWFNVVSDDFGADGSSLSGHLNWTQSEVSHLMLHEDNIQRYWFIKNEVFWCFNAVRPTHRCENIDGVTVYTPWDANKRCSEVDWVC